MTETPLQQRLNSLPALENVDLLGQPVVAALRALSPELAAAVSVTEIDPALADTAAFCERYGVLAEESANCVVVAGRRGEVTTLAACVVLATTRADVNGLVRRTLDVRKISFASMDVAVSESAMEYGGITPIGLPFDWPIFIDRAVVDAGDVVVGSGVRRSKIVVAGSTLAALPNATVLDGLGLLVQ
ncbi:MAG TPA: YbaK/EbsC family protein [Acidothermaceae bacterium]|nr:YbaK/EbsC family protein [Acidothermaceae bacterium]